MFAVIENATNVVWHLVAEQPVVTAEGMVAPYFAADVLPATDSVIEADAPPVAFVPGHLTLIEGAWSELPTYEEALASITPAERVPDKISDRQFFQAFAMAGLITKAEAIDAVAIGAVPAAMEAFFAGMSDYEEFAARMLLQGATTFERHHPLVEAFGAMNGMTPQQVDDLWRMAAGL